MHRGDTWKMLFRDLTMTCGDSWKCWGDKAIKQETVLESRLR